MTVGKQHEIARKLLAVLYNDWAHHQGISLNSLRNEEQWDKNDFDSVIGRLKDLGVIENGTSNSFRLTPDGVLHAEDNAFVPETEVKRHRELRTKALAFLADLYQKNGPQAHAVVDRIAEGWAVNKSDLFVDLSLLNGLGYIEDASATSFRI